MGLHAGSGDCPWIVHHWTWDCVAQSRNLFWTEIVHVWLRACYGLESIACVVCEE